MKIDRDKVLEFLEEQKKQKAKMVKMHAGANPYEHICQHCGVKFGARFSYRYCGLLEGCKNDDSGETKKEMVRLAAGGRDDRKH